jgi:hypothetical protein
MPTKRPPLLGEVIPTFADRGCCVVSATDPPGRILGLLDRSRYYFFQVVSQLYSRVLTRLSGPRSRTTASQKIWKRPGIEPRTSGSVARNSDHYTTEAVSNCYTRIYYCANKKMSDRDATYKIKPNIFD